jgi:hypothetical protein
MLDKLGEETSELLNHTPCFLIALLRFEFPNNSFPELSFL